MIRRILDGSKTQTRRVLKPQPTHFHKFGGHALVPCLDRQDSPPPTCKGAMLCPYSKAGETRLWVKETFYAYGHFQYTGRLTETGKQEVEFVDLTQRSNLGYFYHADSPQLQTQSNKFDLGWHKRPSIFMPREVSRITLEIVNVRVERLQEISAADAKAEGLPDSFWLIERLQGGWRNAWAALWDGINAKRGYSWKSNPWVFVVEFKKL